MSKGPYLPLTEPYATDPYLAAGCYVDNKGKVCKGNEKRLKNLQDYILRNLRIYHETQKVNEYVWYNLPDGLDGNLIERVLFYKGQGIFWYNRLDEKFYFLPYTLSGDIDVYGRYLKVTPLPFNGIAKEEKEAFIVDLKLTPIYDITEILDAVFDGDVETFKKWQEDGCIILRDYTQQISQNNIPRATLDDPILRMMSEAIPFARTSLLSNSGMKAMRVNDETDATEVEMANAQIQTKALEGEPFIPIKAPIEFQELTSAGSAMKSEEYLLYYQAIDNLRKSFIGIPSNGVYEKKSQVLQSEQSMNSNEDNLILQDGLRLRQQFCDMVNLIWGLGIWCEASEAVMGLDKNLDGEAVSEVDQSGAMDGDQPDMTGGEMNE